MCLNHVEVNNGIVVGDQKYIDMMASTGEVDIGYNDDDTLGRASSLDSTGSLFGISNQFLCNVAAHLYFTQHAPTEIDLPPVMFGS